MSERLIAVVDEKDNVVGSEPKSKKALYGFISRVSAVLLADLKGKFFICKRAPWKKIDANKFDMAAVGHVDAGESYLEAAQRELLEETGISCPLVELDKSYQEHDYQGKKIRVFCTVFLGQTGEEPKLNKELVSFRKMTLDEIAMEIKEQPKNFCPGFIIDFERALPKLLADRRFSA